MRILIIEAHPQYAGLFIAGTIFNHTQRGDEVYVVALSDAEGLTNIVPLDEVAEANRHETLEAAKILGIKEVRFLHQRDTCLMNNQETREMLNDIVRETMPNLIITHSPDNTLPDFRETAKAAIDAAFHALLVTQRWNEKFPSHWTNKAYGFELPGISMNFKPDVFVDISTAIDAKIRAMDCFKLQIKANFGNDIEKWHHYILSSNRYWGIESGCQFAEPYALMKIHEVHNKAINYLYE